MAAPKRTSAGGEKLPVSQATQMRISESGAEIEAARAYLTRALAANPNGVDSNFFYGDFLVRQGDYAGAESALQRAINAPPRPGRELADRGRKAQAAALIATARQKTHG